MAVNGVALAAAGTGVILLWSGVHNQSILTAVQDIVQGKEPKAGPKPTTGDLTSAASNAGTISAATGNTGANNTSAAHNQAIAKILAAPFGWSTGQQWEDLVSLWNQESGWSNTAENPSGAYGIAQALGHGPTNQYPAGPANPPTSSASAQIAWGLTYILTTYGSPSAAWAHETADGWY
jgi:hypothetical protein